MNRYARRAGILMLLACVVHINIVFANEVRKPKLAMYKNNIYSQYGEDGILSHILQTIGVQSKVCIEFGAWDGFLYANTALLWRHQGWKGILIECDKERYKDLIQNTRDLKCIALCEKVGVGKQALETILRRYAISYDAIDVLSIDIDGDDYYIFESLRQMRPRVIICEYNPTMPAHLDIYPPYGKIALGCSVGALVRLGKEKGYHLIALTNCNAFFVREDEFSKFANYETSLDKIRIDNYLRYVITDQIGQTAIIGGPNYIAAYGMYGPMPEDPLGSVIRLK